MKAKTNTLITGEFKLEKLSNLIILNHETIGLFQKKVLTRWINTLNIWNSFIHVENMVEELKTGVLICNILKFHQPSLDFTGINLKAKAKKQCLNNIEMALSILY